MHACACVRACVRTCVCVRARVRVCVCVRACVGMTGRAVGHGVGGPVVQPGEELEGRHRHLGLGYSQLPGPR
jgi:hypothetical protein